MTIRPGAIRFNTDSMKLEIFRGSTNYNGSASMAGIGTLAAGQWEEIVATSPEVQTGGTRGILAGGYAPSGYSDVIDYIKVETTGNALDFGDLSSGGQMIGGGCGSRTRGLFGAVSGPAYTNTVDGVEISSTGSQFDYGDLPETRFFVAQLSNQTRGINAGGAGETPSPYTAKSSIDYFTIATSGTTAQDFGDLLHGGGVQLGSCASPTRGLICRANSPSTSEVEFITISTLGNGADFGDLTSGHTQQVGAGGGSNAIRGIFAGGYKSPATSYNNISYVTIATLGNANDFGDLTYSSGELAGCASPTRIAWGTRLSPGNGRTNDVQYLQIMTTGNTVDFGDLTQGRSGGGGTSNGHGGL